MPNRPLSRAALLAAGTLLLLAPLTATTATTTVAAEDTGQGGDRVLAAPYAVEPYETVNVRSGPARSYAEVGSAAAGRPRGAYCWTHGETITGNGRANDVWVQLVGGYASAVHLKGDAYGGLPASATC